MVACVNKTSLSHSFEKEKTIATKFLPSLKSSVNTGGSLQKYHNVVHIDASSMRRRERIAKVEREKPRGHMCAGRTAPVRFGLFKTHSCHCHQHRCHQVVIVIFSATRTTISTIIISIQIIRYDIVTLKD